MAAPRQIPSLAARLGPAEAKPLATPTWLGLERLGLVARLKLQMLFVQTACLE
jgi:hypothetical protein